MFTKKKNIMQLLRLDRHARLLKSQVDVMNFNTGAGGGKRYKKLFAQDTLYFNSQKAIHKTTFILTPYSKKWRQ